MLRKNKGKELHRQNSAVLPINLRYGRKVCAAECDIQGQGVVGIAVIDGDPALAAGGDEACAEGLNEDPWGSYGGDLLICQHGDRQNLVIKGQAAAISGQFACNAGNDLRFRNGEGYIPPWIRLTFHDKHIDLVAVVSSDPRPESAAVCLLDGRSHGKRLIHFRAAAAPQK